MQYLDYKIVLASQSPRRHELLKLAGFDFRILIPDIDEGKTDGVPVREVPVFLAQQKASAVSELAKEGEIIIGCDTIVLLENKIYGKPGNKEEAFRMLRILSGKKHEVISGVCLSKGNIRKVFSEVTEVYFGELKEQEIHYYLEHFQPYDKAGSYAIQEWIGLIGIKRINGDYFNVMGLPVNRLIYELIHWETS